MKILKPLLLLVSLYAVAEDIPLPEHPRPDFERADWLNLNGTWDFRFDDELEFTRKIVVPFGWGSPLSGVPDRRDSAFYRRTVTVPSGWRGKRVFVIIGASDHDTTVSFAGHTLGKHVGGYTPFEFEITDLVDFGEEQTLEAAVWDPNPQTARAGHYLYGKQGYGNARGIWQTVYLEARGERYVKSVHLTPFLATSRVHADVTLDAPVLDATTVEVTADGQTVPVTFYPGESRKSASIPLDEPELWSPQNPHLYDVTVRIPARGKWFGGAEDAVQTYFGFREIGTGKTPNGDPCITLNGKPYYLQLTLDQSYHPEGWYTFPSDEFMKNEILLSKRLALDGNRVHIKVEIPRKLYWADKLGLLIQADVPCAWGNASREMFAEHWACFRDMVARDYNHPSIYQWTLFNETWGLFTNRSLAMGLGAGGAGRRRRYEPWTQDAVAEAYRKAKALDTTRIIEDNSPCNRDHVVTDVNSWHAYRPGYAWEETVAKACAETFPGSKANFTEGNVQRGEPMMNSECGNVWGYAGSTGDCDFTWDYHMMMNAFRRHLKCMGWLYTEHHDVINEWNGYVRFDRSPKYDGLDDLAGMTIADFHAPAAIFFAGDTGRETGATFMQGARFALPVGVSLVTDAYAGKRLSLGYTMWFYDAEGERRELDEGAAIGQFTARTWQCEKLWDVPIALPDEAACGCVVFSLRADDEEIARNFYAFATVDTRGAKVVPVAAEWSEGTTNVLGALKFNGFGQGSFEYVLDAPAEGGTFRAELSAKRRNGKDNPERLARSGLDFMLGGGTYDRSWNPNSYPQTSDEKHPARVKVYVDGELAEEVDLPDDPADHRGILSWLAQPRAKRLYEAGSYGWTVEAKVPAEAVRDGKVRIRLESDAGLAVYGRAFGRYPFDPHVAR